MQHHLLEMIMTMLQVLGCCCRPPNAGIHDPSLELGLVHGNLRQTKSEHQIDQTSLWNHAMCIMVQWCRRTAAHAFYSDRLEGKKSALESEHGWTEWCKVRAPVWCSDPNNNGKNPRSFPHGRASAPAKFKSRRARSWKENHGRPWMTTNSGANDCNVGLPYRMLHA